MAITVTDDGGVVWKLEGGMSLKLILREADGEEVRNGDVRAVLPDPTGKPIISARFQYFDRVGPRDVKQIAKEHIVFRPLEFSSEAVDHFRRYIGMGMYGLEPLVDHFFSSGDSVERLYGFNSTSDVGYFCLDVTREGWVGSPYFWAWLDPLGDEIKPGNPYFEAAKEAEATRRVEAARALREAEALNNVQIEPRSLVEQVMRHESMQEETEADEPPSPQGSYSDSDSDMEVVEMPLGPTRADWMRRLHSGKWSLTHQCFHDTDCAICLERLIEGDRVTAIPCHAQGHCFHTDCIVPWLNVMNLCPLCRYYMPTTTTTTIQET